jgi:hypothetical protein
MNSELGKRTQNYAVRVVNMASVVSEMGWVGKSFGKQLIGLSLRCVNTPKRRQ